MQFRTNVFWKAIQEHPKRNGCLQNPHKLVIKQLPGLKFPLRAVKLAGIYSLAVIFVLAGLLILLPSLFVGILDESAVEKIRIALSRILGFVGLCCSQDWLLSWPLDCSINCFICMLF